MKAELGTRANSLKGLLNERKSIKAVLKYIARTKRLENTFGDIRRTIEEFIAAFFFSHRDCLTPVHHNIKGNDRADDLATAATRHIDSLAASYANARRREGLLKKWTEIWRHDSPAQTVRFTLANRLPPRKHFTTTTTREYRTSHVFIGEYYTSFVPTEPTGCPCGNCAKLEHVRVSSMNHSSTQTSHEVPHNLIPSKIMDTKKGIMALVKFIESPMHSKRMDGGTKKMALKKGEQKSERKRKVIGGGVCHIKQTWTAIGHQRRSASSKFFHIKTD
ncbi:hypothetical protein BDR03DRAFT_1003103 [Suillus americanus]|nr:hypothetical protein BDR03DRAFT_1003103 [Suillus americanus]